jgi:hypothetical protein
VRMTLGEYTRLEKIRRAARLAAEAADPEFQARRAEFEAHNARMIEAERAWSIKNRLSIAYSAGETAFANDEPEDAPGDLPDDEAAEWLTGWNSALADAARSDDEGGVL